jgi:capsular polysaccharide transport system permease protein
MEHDPQIVERELSERDTPRLRSSLFVGALADVVARRVSGAADGENTQGLPRRSLPLPNAHLASFIAVVLIPSLVCFVYLAFIASDQYVAEARFAVQSVLAAPKTSGALGALGAGALPALGGQDAYIVTNYIHSRAVIDDLDGKIDIRAIFQRPEGDFWARLKNNPSAEELTYYWNQMVGTNIDGPSGIVTLTVRAFRPADAEMLAQAVTDASEKLVNKVSSRARTTIMRQAEDEVRRGEGLVRAALDDMRNFRDQQGFIDPVSAATSTSLLLQQAMAQEISLQNNYFVASKAMSPNAPTVVGLKTRLDGLEAQIAKLKGELAGDSPQGGTIAASLVAFEQLELKRTFAEKLYTMAQDGLERARQRAEQQNIFVNTFVPPSLPQEAKYPQRLSLSLLIPIGLGVFWGIFALIGAAIEDHRY